MEHPPLHPEAEAILKRLAREGITYLYHFTAIDNLKLLCASGALCSKAILQKLDLLDQVTRGGNVLSQNLDILNDNWNKVSLSFTPYLPMAYYAKRQQHLCYLCIKPEVATFSGVFFTDTNANKSDHRRAEASEGLDLVHFDVIHSIIRYDWNIWKRYVQAEILVPDRIALEYVEKIAFVSQASLEHAARLCDSLDHPRFVVDPGLFTDSSGASSQSIGFPYVESLSLSGAGISQEHMVYLDRNIYSNRDDTPLTVDIIVRALAGTRLSLLLRSQTHSSPVPTPTCAMEEPPFLRKDRYALQKKLPLNELADGAYLVECFMDGICRASASFYLSHT